jgi:Tfp pilus assembly protein PilO
MDKLLELLNRIKQLDKNKLIAFLAAFGVIIFLDFVFVINAQYKAAVNDTKKIAELKKNIQDIESKAKELAAKQARGQNALPAKPKKVKPASELPLLLQEISDMAKDNDVKVVQIVHTKGAKPKDNDLIPITIRLSLNCGYHNLGSFIQTLEDAEQPLSCDEVLIARNPNDAQRERVDIGLKTYVK